MRAKKYCCEDISLIENYEQAKLDNFEGWVCHHKLEIHSDYRNKAKDLKKMRLYYKRPACELIFLKWGEHSEQHQTGRKRPDIVERNKKYTTKGQIRSEFGKKYFEHFGIKRLDNVNQYKTEWQYWNTHNHKCRWEV